MIPGEVTSEWEHLLNKVRSRNDKGIDVGDLFQNVPLALLKMRMMDNARGAGILHAHYLVAICVWHWRYGPGS